MATVAATKTISFKAPYTGASFQSLTGLLMGRDGYISGGETADDTVVVTVQPTVFLQRGLVVQSLVAATGIPVPTADEPWFLLASTPDDDPDSGAIFTATADLATAASSVIVAFKTNGTWTNSVGVNVATAGERDSEVGSEEDLGITDLRTLAGVVSSITAYKGLLVDPTGKRRTLRTPSTSSAASLTESPMRPNSLFDRNDHVVLRQLESFSPDLRTIIGGAIGPAPAESLIESGASVDRPSHFAKRGGAIGEQWWAWGNGTDLKILGGPGGEGFAISVLLVGTAITSTYVAGQRSSDDAVLVLYVDSADLRLVSFNATTGTLIDAAVTLEALPGQISHVRAVLDRNEMLHITFEHDEVRQQVYYTRVRITTGAQFGTADVSPRIINGSDSGSNDTWPSIGVDRLGVVTVAHIRGAGTNEFGDLVVAAIDQNGDTVSQNVILASSDIGVDPGPTLSPTGYPGVGASALAFTNVRRTSVVVTPHDEVYVFTIGLSTGTDPDFILVHSPSFQEDHGFELINVTPQLTTANYGIVALDAAVGEAGEIYLCHKRSNTTSTRTRLIEHTFATPLLRDGKVPAPIWGEEQFVDVASVDTFEDLHVSKGSLGEFVVSYMIATTATIAQRAPLSDSVDVISGVYSTPGLPQRHPKDIYLGTWSVPKSASTTLDGHDPRLEVFSTRSKKMNYPILVGQKGDFQGFGSLAQAVERANRDGGGEIILRPGVHRTISGLSVGHGISIRGEGAASIIAESSTGLITFAGRPSFSVTVAGNVLTDTGGSEDLAAARPGDMISLDTSGLHVVVRNLGPNPSTGLPRVVVEDGAAGVPVGTSAYVYASGARLENVTLISTTAAAQAVFQYCHRPILRNVRVEGPTSTAVIFTKCDEALIDGLDLTGVTNTDADRSLWIESSSGVVVRGVKFADGKGKFYIASTAEDLHVIGCSSDGADASKVIYEIGAGRTSPVFMSSCEGRISGVGADFAFLITNTGRRLRQPEGLGQLEFEDDNTRASTITDDGIKLSSAAHKQFDGVATDIITDAVNERLLTGGDTMTGDIVMDLGANLYTSGASADSAVGADGAAVDRFAIFANAIQAAGDISFKTDQTYDLAADAIRPTRSFTRYLDVGGGVDAGYPAALIATPVAGGSELLTKWSGNGGDPFASSVGIDYWGGLRRYGAYMHEEWDTTAVDANKWTTTGGGSTTFSGNHTISCNAPAGVGNRQIVHNNFAVLTANRPRFLSNGYSNLGGDDRIYIGWLGCFFIYDPQQIETAPGAGSINWWIRIGATAGTPGGGQDIDLGVPFTMSAIETQSLEMAIVANNKLAWRIGGYEQATANDFSGGYSGVITTVANPIADPGSVFFKCTNDSATPGLYFRNDFIESYECRRPF